MNSEIHKASERGTSNLGWLLARFSFSFAQYYNPERMGFGTLRVLNNDIIQPSRGFGTHPHKDMEIITIVLRGKLAHKDSTGQVGSISAGEVQVMSAGSGILHSEFNGSSEEEVELFQIWIHPSKQGVTPRYDQRAFSLKQNKITPLVSGDHEADTLFIHQDAIISRCLLGPGKVCTYKQNHPSHGLYIFVISGDITIENNPLGKRDAIAITQWSAVTITAANPSDVLFFEVPMTPTRTTYA